MALRESIAKSPTVVMGIAGAAIAISLGAIIWQAATAGTASSSADAGVAKVYFTTDTTSGPAAIAAMFPDSADKLPPFDHNGKPAVRVRIWTTDGGTTRYVSHYERHTPKAIEAVAALRQKFAHLGEDHVKAITKEQLEFGGGTEIKLVDTDAWRPAPIDQATMLKRISPDPAKTPTEVLPGSPK
jgi:hypothetical protein